MTSFVVLTEYYSPSTAATAQLIADLVAELQYEGLDLKVLTGTPGPSCSNVIRLKSTLPFQSTHIASKALRGVSFLCKSFVWLVRNRHSYSRLLIISNPPFIGFVGLLLHSLLRKPYDFLLQDLFPRSATITGVLPSQGPVTWLWTALMGQICTEAHNLIVLSDSMSRRAVCEYGLLKAPHIIHNWSVESPTKTITQHNQLIQKWGLAGFFVVQYSGNHGRVHDFLTLLEAARKLENDGFKFLFIGDGPKKKQVLTYKENFNLKSILLKPYQPRDTLSVSLSACDVGVVTMISGAEDTVAPSKFYGIIAQAKPVLLLSTSQSELSKLIEEHRCGIAIEHGDVHGLIRALQFLKNNPSQVHAMGLAAYDLYLQSYGASISAKKYKEILFS